jgi:hypothetical protein
MLVALRKVGKSSSTSVVYCTTDLPSVQQIDLKNGPLGDPSRSIMGIGMHSLTLSPL